MRGNAHAVGHPNAHAGVLVVHQDNFAVRGVDGDGVVDHAAGFVRRETDQSAVRGNGFAGLAHPFVLGMNHAIFIHANLYGHLFAAVGIFAPEIMHAAVLAAFHMTMTPEQAAVVPMVIGFPRQRGLHGITPRHSGAINPADGIKRGLRHTFISVTGEEFAIDFHINFPFGLGEGDVGGKKR